MLIGTWNNITRGELVARSATLGKASKRLEKNGGFSPQTQNVVWSATMLQISNLEKQFGERELFSGATLTVNSGERVALFGRNGSGKSTLLKIIAGEETQDQGDVSTPRGLQSADSS